MSMLKVYLIYTAAMSLIALILFATDKLLSKNENNIRLPEELLLTPACFGGSVGALFGIYVVRHKTKFKTKFHFIIGTWISFAVQAAIGVCASLAAAGYIGGGVK